MVTSQALPDLPPQTEIRLADFAALAAELRQHQDGDVWLLGGHLLWQGFLDVEAFDRF